LKNKRNSEERSGRTGKIRVAIIGAGNCASSLIQGIEYYNNAKDTDAKRLTEQSIKKYWKKQEKPRKKKKGKTRSKKK
jgi:myo-inositol-1-phosphate synthase